MIGVVVDEVPGDLKVDFLPTKEASPLELPSLTLLSSGPRTPLPSMFVVSASASLPPAQGDYPDAKSFANNYPEYIF